MRPRAFYVVARNEGAVCFAAGPYPSVQAAWHEREPVLDVVRGAEITASGVAMLESLDPTTLFPPGSFNDRLERRYWQDANGRNYCAHGLITMGNLCVDCEKKDMQ